VDIGSNGTATSQLYVSGEIPSSSAGSVSTGSNPRSVYVSGRYAYVAGSTLGVYDVSNPASPVLVGNTSTNISTPYSVYVQGRYAYVANEGSSTLGIYDISNPASPVSVSNFSTGGSSTPYSVYVSGRYAYVAEYGSRNLGIYDVSNPASPVSVGSISTGATSNPDGVYVSGHYAYVTSVGTNKLTIYDVSNPASPVLVGTASCGTNPFTVYVQGNYAYVVSNSNGIYVIDISNPADPVLTGTTGIPGAGPSPYSVYVSGRYAYVADENTGYLTVVDVSTPASPTVVGSVPTGSNPESVFVSGRYAYVANEGSSTLQVFDLGGSYIQQLQAGSTETGTLQVDADAQIGGDENIQGGVTVGSSLQVAGNATLGGLAINSLTTSAAPTLANVGAGSGTNYTYEVGAFNPSGQATSPTATIANGATLSSTVYNTVTWSAVSGATGYNVYRTAGGSSQGLIVGAVYPSTTTTTPTVSAFSMSVDTATITFSATVPMPQYTVGQTVTLASFTPSGINQTGVITSVTPSSNQIQVTLNANYTETGLGTVTGNLSIGDTGLAAAGTSPTASSNTTGTLDVAGSTVIGSTGTPTSQLFVSGNVPAGAIGSITAGSGAYYVVVSGKYAYVVNYNSPALEIYDVSNPASPVLVGSVSTESASYESTSVYVAGRYAYVTIDGTTSYLEIYDVSNPASPVLVGSVVTGGTNGDPDDVYVSGRYAYVAITGSHDLGIYDISNPASPVLVGSVSTGSTGYDPTSVYVAGRYAYVTIDGTTSYLEIYDVSNAATPVQVDSISTGTSPSSVYVAGNYAYVANSASYTLGIYDVSNPADAVLVDTVSTGGSSQPDSVYVSGRYAYVANDGTNNLGIYDISNPASPQPVGTVSTGAGSHPFSVFVSGRYAYVITASTSDLEIFDLGGSYIQQLQAGSTETGTLQVDADAQIGGDENIQGGVTVGSSLQVAGNATLGGLAINSLTTSAAPTLANVGAGSGTNYTYEVGAFNPSGQATSPTATIANGATLSSTVYNTVTWSAVSGATGYNVYRTAGGSSQGLIVGAVYPSTTTTTPTVSAFSMSVDTATITFSATVPMPQYTVGQTVTLASFTPSGINQTGVITSVTPSSNQIQVTLNANYTETGLGTVTGNLSIGDTGLAAAGTSPTASSNTTGNLTISGTSNLTGTTNLSTVVDSGPALFEDSANSSTAFQIQNASAVDVLDANTSTGQINLGTMLGTPGTITPLIAPTISSVSPVCFSSCTFTYGYEVTSVSAKGAETLASSDVTSGAAAGQVLSTSVYNVVTWGAVTNAAYYRIYRVSSTGTTNSLGLIGEVATGTTTFSDKGYVAGVGAPALASSGSLTAATTYYYEVTALDDTGGQSAASGQASQAPTPYTSQTLSWAPVAGARAYNVYRSTTTNVYTTDSYYTTYTNSFTDTGGVATGSNTVPPTAATASAYANNITNNATATETIGNSGTATGQLYVGGSIPTAAVGSVSTGASPFSVFISGHYAYVANESSSTLGIYDVSNPTNPTAVSSTSTGTSAQPEAVYVSGRYAYVTNEGNSTLAIFDVSNPVVPVLIDTISTGTNPGDIYVSGRYAYIANEGSSTLTIYDVSNPYNTLPVSSVSTGSASEPISVYVSGRYAYVANSNNNTLGIIDVSNPVIPLLVGSVSTGSSTPDPVSVYVSGHYAYVANNNASTLGIFDVSDPSNPVSVGSVSTGSSSQPESVYVAGRYAYVADKGAASMSIIDVSNPADPVSITNVIPTGSNPFSVFVSGRYAYVANEGSSTLQVFDLGGTYTQTLQAGSTETGNLQVDNNATISGDESVTGSISTSSSLQAAGNASLGGLTINSIATPAQPTVTPVGGSATTYNYAVAAFNNSGSSPASTSGTTTTGAATLTATAYNTITWGAVTGAVGYNIYRATTTGSYTAGYIGTVYNGATLTFNDTGITSSGSLPSTNTAGELTAYGTTQLVGTTTVNGAANFTGTLAATESVVLQDADANPFAFSVDNTVTGSQILSAGTTNLIVNGDFEGGTGSTGWIAYGTGSSIAQNTNTTNSYTGDDSLAVTVGTTSAAGAEVNSFNQTLPIGTYSLSFYAKASTAFSTLAANFFESSNTACTLNSTSVTTTGFTQYYCTITTTAATTYIDITDGSGTTALTFYIDGVQLTPAINLLTNPGFENGSTGWSTHGTGSFITLNNNANLAYSGVGSLQVVTGSTGNAGAETTSFTSSIPAGTYTISLDAGDAGTAFSTLSFGVTYSAGSTACSTITPLPTTINVPTGGFVRYSCTLTATATVTGLYVDSTAASSSTFYIDAVQISGGSAVLAYNIGSIQLRGVINSPVSFQGLSNTTTAFQIQNAAGTSNLFIADTLDNQIDVGGNLSLTQSTNSIDTSGTNTLDIGNTNAAILNIGNTTAATALNLFGGGTGGIKESTGASGTITLGSTSAANAVVLGDSGSATNADNISINNTTGTETGTITLGGTGSTGTIIVGQSSGTNTVELGDGTGATTVDIGNGGAAAGNAEVVAIGSGSTTTAGSTVTLQGSNIVASTNNDAGIIIGAGYSATSANLIPLTLDSSDAFTEAANTCLAADNGGSLYYNTVSNTVRGCINGKWDDLLSTQGLGLMLFGIVPDSGSTDPGDLAGVTGTANGPCKASVGANTTTVAWTSCTAYSGGRKVLVTAGSLGTTNTTAGDVQHLCLTGTNDQPALSTAAAITANLATVSMPSANSPIVCLADIQFSAANSTITTIYDVRTFTTTVKIDATLDSNAGLGTIAQWKAATGETATPALTANLNNLAGVVVATTGALSTNTINAIIAINGPAWVKATAGTVGQFIFTGATTAGYAVTVATKPAESTSTIYNLLGWSQVTWTGSGTCTANSDVCEGSLFTSLASR
jgi:hypothetical protein